MKIQSSNDANLLINSAIRSHSDYWQLIHNQEEEIMNGKPPFPFKEVEKKGLTWSNNRNYGAGRSQVEQAVVGNVTDILKSISLMELDFVDYDPKKHKQDIDYFLIDPYLRDIISDKIVGAFEETLLETEKLKPFISKIEYNSFCFGYCPITRDIFGFMGTANHVTSIAFEDRTKVGDINTWVSFDVIKADVIIKKLHQLEGMKAAIVRAEDGGYSIYENGWIKEGLLLAVTLQLNKMKLKNDRGSELTFSTWDNVKDLMTEKGQTWLEMNLNNIHIAKIFTKEEDESFTETYIQTTASVALSNSESYVSCQNNLMYQRSHKGKTFNKFINLVKEYSVSSSEYVQELRGAGKQVASYSLWYNIKRNAVEDKLLLSGGPVFSAPQSLIEENVKLQVMGGFVILPEQVAFAPNQIRYDLQDHIQSLSIDKQEHNEQTFHYRPKSDLSNRPTKDEVQMVGREVSKQSQNRLPFKFLDYSSLFTNILHDLAFGDYDNSIEVEKQKLFYCKLKTEFAEFGIKDEDIKHIVSLVRKLSIFPVLQDLEAIKEALQVTPSPMARKKLLRMFFLALGFSRKDINILTKEEEYGNELEKAATENAAFYNTSEIIFTLGQDHLTHLNTHFAKMDRIFQGLKQGEDPVKGYNYIMNALSNTQKHVAALENHPFYKNRFKEYFQIQKHFDQSVKVLAEDIAEMQKQAQQQRQQNGGEQQLPPEVQQRMYIDKVKAIEKIKRTDMLTQAAQERVKQNFEFKKQLAKQELDSKISNEKELAELKKEIELLKASTKM